MSFATVAPYLGGGGGGDSFDYLGTANVTKYDLALVAENVYWAGYVNISTGPHGSFVFVYASAEVHIDLEGGAVARTLMIDAEDFVKPAKELTKNSLTFTETGFDSRFTVSILGDAIPVKVIVFNVFSQTAGMYFFSDCFWVPNELSRP